MDLTSIDKFLNPQQDQSVPLELHLKNKGVVAGIFIRWRDYQELKTKNFWRFVHLKNIPLWEQSNSIEFTRIYMGSTITRIAPMK